MTEFKLIEITLFAYATREEAVAICEQTEEPTLVAGVNIFNGKAPSEKNVAYLVLPQKDYPDACT